MYSTLFKILVTLPWMELESCVTPRRLAGRLSGSNTCPSSMLQPTNLIRSHISPFIGKYDTDTVFMSPHRREGHVFSTRSVICASRRLKRLLRFLKTKTRGPKLVHGLNGADTLPRYRPGMDTCWKLVSLNYG